MLRCLPRGHEHARLAASGTTVERVEPAPPVRRTAKHTSEVRLILELARSGAYVHVTPVALLARSYGASTALRQGGRLIALVRSLFPGRIPRSAGGALALATIMGSLSAPSNAMAMQSTSAGVVQGTVEVQRRPTRRRAQRYPAGGAQAARAVQELPAAVYLRGGPPVTGPAASTVSVSQQDTAFVPAVLAVPRGSTVDFMNEDPFFHNVFSYSQAKRFDLGRYPAGQSKSVTFEEAGIVKVYCEVHDFMRAAVLVLDNPYYSAVADDGSFTIRDVPPGTYEVVAWHTDFDERVVAVTVASGETVTVEVTLR